MNHQDRIPLGTWFSANLTLLGQSSTHRVAMDSRTRADMPLHQSPSNRPRHRRLLQGFVGLVLGCCALLLGMEVTSAQSSPAVPSTPSAESNYNFPILPLNVSDGARVSPAYRRIFVRQADLPELALDGFRPLEVDQLARTLDAYEQATAPMLGDAESASNGIASFHAQAKLTGADLLSDRSRIVWEVPRDARGNPLARVTRTLLSPWSLALDNPIFRLQDTGPATLMGPSFGLQTPTWVFDDLGRPMVRNDTPEEWFTWSLRPIKDSSPNRLNYALSIPRTPNSCLVLQLPKGARVADASVVARPVDSWNEVLARVGSWPTNPTLPETARDSAPSDIYWILELSGQEQASFSVLLGSSGAAGTQQGFDLVTSYSRLIARQSVQVSISSDIVRTVAEWDWTELGNAEGPIKLRLPVSARLKSLTLNDREPELQFSERTVEILLPTMDASNPGLSPNNGTINGVKMRLNVELLTPRPPRPEPPPDPESQLPWAESQPRSIAIEPIEMSNAYVVAGTLSLVPMPPLQVHDVTTTSGRLESVRVLPHGGNRLDYSWFHRLPTVRLLSSPLTPDQRAELITRLSTDNDRVSAAIRMQLTPWKDPQPREIRIASGWRMDAAQLNTKSMSLQTMETAPNAGTRLRLESTAPNETTPIQLELQLSRELPADASLRLDSEPLIELPAWRRTDALIVEPNPAIRLELDAIAHDWSLDEETLTQWQKDRLPRLGKYLIFRMEGGVLPPLTPRNSTSVLSANIDSRLRRLGNRWAIEHHFQLPANLSKRDALSIRAARDAHWNLQTSTGPRVPHVRYDSNADRWLIEPSVLIERDDRNAPIHLVATHTMPAAARMELELPGIDGALIASRTCSAEAGLELLPSDSDARWGFDPAGNAELRWSQMTTNSPIPSVQWLGLAAAPPRTSWISRAQLDVAIDPSGSQKASLLARVLTQSDTLDLRFEAAEDWRIVQATRIGGASPNEPLRVERAGKHVRLQRTLSRPSSMARTSPSDPLSARTEIDGRSTIALIEVILVGPTQTARDRPFFGILPNRTLEFAWPRFALDDPDLQLERHLWVSDRLHVHRQATSEALVVVPDAPLPASNKVWWTLWGWTGETLRDLGWQTSAVSPNDTSWIASDGNSTEPYPASHSPEKRPPRNLVPGWIDQDWRLALSDTTSTETAADSAPVPLSISGDSPVPIRATVFALAVALTPWLLRFHAWWCFGLAILTSLAGHWCAEPYAVLARCVLVGLGTGTILYQLYVVYSTRDRRRGPKVQAGDRWLPWNEPALVSESLSEGSQHSRHGAKAVLSNLLLVTVTSPWWWGAAELPPARGQDPVDRVPRATQRLVDVLIPIDDAGGLAGTVVYVPEWMLRDIERMENAQKNLDRDAILLSAKHVLRLDSRSIGFGNTDQACVHSYEFWVGDQALDRPLRIPLQADRTRLSRFTVDGTEVISSRLARTDSELIWYPDRVGRRLLQVEAQTRVRPSEPERTAAPGVSIPNDPKQTRSWNVETAILPCANAILEIETDGQWTIDLSARGKLANPSIGRFALHLGNLDRISGSASPSQANAARPFIAMPSDNPSLNTETPIMNTELFIDREQLMARTTLEYPRSTETLGELEIESDQQWQPIGTIWGDAQLVDVKPGSTLDRKRYVLRWTPEANDANPPSSPASTALPTKRAIVTTWIPTGDTPLRNVLFAECRDRRVRFGTLRYARTAGSVWTIDGVNTWIPSINARERIEWPELVEKPIATSLKIPVSGGFGVLRQQLDSKPIRARVTNQWWIDRHATSLRSKLEFSSPITNRVSLRIRLPEGFKAVKATARNSAIAFTQWTLDGLNHLQLWIDRDNSEMSELTITCDGVLADSNVERSTVPSIHAIDLVAQEQITDIAADAAWSLQIDTDKDTDKDTEADPMPSRGQGPTKNLISVPFSQENPTPTLTQTRCDAPWSGLMIVHPQDATATGSDWELLVLVDRTPTMRPELELAIPMPWAARWSTAQPSQEILDLNLQRRIVSLRPDLSINTPRMAMSVAWGTEAKQTVSPELASQILAMGNSGMECWYAIHREDAEEFGAMTMERLDDAIAQPWLAIAGLQQHVLIRPPPATRVAAAGSPGTSKTTPNPNALLDAPSSVTLAQPNTAPMSDALHSDSPILLATHSIDSLPAASNGRTIVRSTFWITATPETGPARGTGRWLWSLPSSSRCEWVRFNGESVSFQAHEGQLAVNFNPVHSPMLAEIWTSVPTANPIDSVPANWVDATPASVWTKPSASYWISSGLIEREATAEYMSDDGQNAISQAKADATSRLSAAGHPASGEAWIAAQTTAWLTLLEDLQSSDRDPDALLPPRFGSGTLGRWHRFFAEQTFEALTAWARLPSMQRSADYAAAVARWQSLRKRLPPGVGTRRLPTDFVMQSIAHHSDVASKSTAPSRVPSGSDGNTSSRWSAAFAMPWLTRSIASLSTVLTIVMLAWLWQSTKHWLIQSPWWHLVGVGALIWIVTGWVVPAMIPIAIGWIVSIDSYWMINERFRQTAIRGPR